MKILSWLWDWKAGSKSQVGLGSNPPVLSNLLQSGAGPQNGSTTPEALHLVRANVDGADSTLHSTEADKRMDAQDVAKDVTLGGAEPLGPTAEIPKPVPPHHNEAPRDSSEQRGLTAQISPAEVNIAHHSDAPEVSGRSQALRSLWNQLDNTVDSFTGTLITAGDLRREGARQRENAVREIESILASTGGDDFRVLQDILFGLQQVDKKLQEEDKHLIQQGSQILRQGSKIFGPAAESSFQVLDDQGVVVHSQDTATEESVLSTDDIRLDQTSEARRYLSKKGDVDLLRETLMDLEVERIMMFEANEQPDTLEALEVRLKEVLNELREAEEDLARLHDELPERNVSHSKEQVRPPSDLGQIFAGQSDIDNGNMGDNESGSHSRSEGQGNSLSQILESATQDNPVRSTTLVNAYLLYQLQRSSQEQQNFSEAVEEARRRSDQALETEANNLPLDRWFEEEKSKQSRSGNMFSQGFSRGTNADTTAHVQQSHGQTEPHERRKAPEDDYTRPRSMFAPPKANNMSSLR